jgi:hypothetical protein
VSRWHEEYGQIYEGERVVCRKNFDVSDGDPQWKADAKLIVDATELRDQLRKAVRILSRRYWTGAELREIREFVASEDVVRLVGRFDNGSQTD